MRLIANGLGLEVEQHGPADAEPLVLIMGLGMQLVAWEQGLVDRLVEHGFRVIRFDNRDAGLSDGFEPAGVPPLGRNWLRHVLGRPIAAPYRLADMADDTAALLAGLGVASAHVCGASMGGMIAQHLAVRHPERVRSLTLMMSSSGARRLPGPTLGARRALVSRRLDPRDIDAIVAHHLRVYRAIGSPAYPADNAYARDRVTRAVRRAYRPDGALRQLTAIAADADRSALLARIEQPTCIVHGEADPLVPVAAAHDLAAKIRGARLHLVPGMGHDLPPPLWPRFVEAIAAVATAARR